MTTDETKHLTPEQQKLVEDNHSLIYGFANQNGLDIEEYYGDLAIALCNAAIKYDESRGRFSTLAYTAMRNTYIKRMREASRQGAIPESKLCSVQTVVMDSGIGEPIRLEDIIPDMSIMIEREVLAKDSYKRMTERLSNREKQVLPLLVDGYSQVEVANKLGVTRSRISEVVKHIRKKLETE